MFRASKNCMQAIVWEPDDWMQDARDGIYGTVHYEIWRRYQNANKAHAKVLENLIEQCPYTQRRHGTMRYCRT